MQTDIRKQLSASLPIVMREMLESTPYALRLTPMGKYGDEQIKDFLKGFEEYIYVNEKSKKGKEHSHVVLWSKLDEHDVREKVREFLKKYFIGNPKRGDANKQYNLSEVEDVELAVTYILKDNEVYYSSDCISKTKIEQLKKQSYKKFSKEDFAVELEKLKRGFKDDDPSLEEMMISVVKLKSLYRQPVNMNYIYQMCVSFHIHNNPNRSERYVGEFLSRH